MQEHVLFDDPTLGPSIKQQLYQDGPKDCVPGVIPSGTPLTHVEQIALEDQSPRALGWRYIGHGNETET